MNPGEEQASPSHFPPRIVPCRGGQEEQGRKRQEVQRARGFLFRCCLFFAREALLYREETCSLSLQRLEEPGLGMPAHPSPNLVPVLTHRDASWPMRLSHFSGTPPSPGWSGVGGVLPGRAGKEAAWQMGDLAHSTTNEPGPRLDPQSFRFLIGIMGWVIPAGTPTFPWKSST